MSYSNDNLIIDTLDTNIIQDIKQGKPLDFSFKNLITVSSTNTQTYL